MKTPEELCASLREELQQLEERLEKLLVFLESDDCLKLPMDDLALLQRQSDYMAQYRGVLKQRLIKASEWVNLP